MFRDILARQPPQPGNLASQSLVVGVAAPEQARQPGRTAFGQQEAQFGKLVEDSVADERDQMVIIACGQSV
jgi:hypothetical protein